MSLVTVEYPPAEAVRKAALDSQLIKSLDAARAITPQSRDLRALTADEIRVLQSQNNAAEDWARVWVAQDFNPSKVVGCYFTGQVLMGSFREKVALEAGVRIGSGVYNCALHNVSIADNCLLSDNNLIANYHIFEGAVVQGNGNIVCTGTTRFGTEQSASLGLEMPGRDTGFYAEITVDVAAQIAGGRKDKDLLAAYELALHEYRARTSAPFGVIGEGAVVRNTPKVLDTFVGPNAIIDGATWVENSTILSNADESSRVASGAYVKDSILQWGTRVETHALVDNSVCCEFSYADEHAKLHSSLLGPNSGVSSGECSHSLVGPFVGFHHESLLIAAYWPKGKGNVSYGSNVGSNHTSKAADQEIWPGEGMFFGLSVDIKYPADYSNAPYTIVATGVTTLPQRVEMPFSLINNRAESIPGISPAYNEIMPGWVLSDNIYTIRRNERKYAIRDKASRNKTGFEVFRPDIVDMMVRARKALQRVESVLTPARAASHRGVPIVDVAHRPVYTDKDVPGLGKNFMREIARIEGIDAYTFYIRYYALKGLYFAVRFALQQKQDPARVLETGYVNDPRYEHELALLQSEFPGRSVGELLRELVHAQEKVLADTQLSKEKDNFRGIRIIPDYAEVHLPASEDPFVKATQQETAELKADVESLLKRLD